MIEVSDEQLFNMMGSAGSNQEQANLAWGEFFRRYKRYLWQTCLHHCKALPESEETAKDLFQTTMQKVFTNAKKFDFQKSSSVKSWVSKMAFNEFQDYFKKYHLKFTNELPDDVEEELQDIGDDSVAEVILDIKFEKLKKLLSHLSEKEYKILITYMSYYQIDNPNAHLPDDVMRELCSEFGIQPPAARQIKRRALLKLKKIAEQVV